MRKSLRKDLSFRIGLVIFCIGIIIVGAYYFFSVRSTEKEFNEDIASKSKSISDTFTLQLWLFDLNTTQELCKLFLESSEVVGLRLLDHKKSVIFQKDPPQEKNIIPIHKELHYKDQTLVGYVDIYFSNRSWQQQRARLFLIGISIVIGAILGSFFFINLLLKQHLSKPLENLLRHIEGISQGDFHPSKLTGQKQEIQSIIDGFNQLVFNLSQRDREISQKTAALEKEIDVRRETEIELSESQKEWERTFNAMSDLITIKNKDLKILQANKAVLDFLKLEQKEVIGKHCFELYHGTKVPCAHCPDILAFDERRAHSATISREKLGKVFQVTSFPIFDNKNEFNRVVHIAEDITEAKRMEADLFHAQKMEAVGTLAAGIAHDFNNVLSVILLYAEMSLVEENDLGKIRKYVSQVLTAGNRAKELVKQILTFSRKEQTSKEPMQPSFIIT